MIVIDRLSERFSVGEIHSLRFSSMPLCKACPGCQISSGYLVSVSPEKTTHACSLVFGAYILHRLR